MLPDSEHRPTCFAQPIDLFGIPLDIACDLRIPVAAVGSRPPGVVGTPVPKAPVNKYRNSLAGECDVRSGRPRANRHRVVNPEPPAASVKCRAECYLRLGVPATDRLHIGGARRWPRRRGHCSWHRLTIGSSVSRCSRIHSPRSRTPSSSHPRWWAISWRTVRSTWALSRSASWPKSRSRVSR